MRPAAIWRALLLTSALPFVFGSWLLAFNPAAHIYIAESVYPGGPARIDLRYGAIAPDIAWFLTNPSDWPTAGADTHIDFIQLDPARWSSEQKSFARGWLSHNEVFGADNVAHVRWNNTTPGYVVQKATTLVGLVGSPLTLDLAHSVIETAVDLLVKEHLDPQIANKVLYCVLLRSSQDKALMDETFVWESHRTSWWTLTGSEIQFRTISFQYAVALGQSTVADPGPLVTFATQLASNLGITLTPTQGAQIISAALTLCSDDFDDAIQDAIDQLEAH